MDSVASDRPNVYVLDPYHQDALDILLRHGDINVVLPSDPEVSKWSTFADAILVRSETHIGKADMAKAEQLKCIVKQGVGVDNIDLEAAKDHHIKVYNTPGVNSEAVAELTITLALCVARRVCEIDRLIMSNERVVRSQMLGKSLFGKTLGVIGMGAIGLEVSKKWLGAMNGHVVGFDPYAQPQAWTEPLGTSSWSRVDNLADLLKASDVVSIHVPLTPSTKNLISAAELALMRPDSILLNCARGGIVDEEALEKALKSGHLFGAGLDAMLYEPPTLSHYGNTLLSCPRVVMVPHVGASTTDNQIKSGTVAVQLVLDFLKNGPDALPPSLA